MLAMFATCFVIHGLEERNERCHIHVAHFMVDLLLAQNKMGLACMRLEKFEKTSIVCYLMIENLEGVRIFKESGSWRSSDKIRRCKQFDKDSIVFYFMIEDLGGVMILK